MLSNIKILQGLVQPKQFIAITDWNKQRNNLECVTSLEEAMLYEELREYFDATELVDKLDAVCDYLFVGVGTTVKGAFCGNSFIPQFADDLEVILSDFAGRCAGEGMALEAIGPLISDGLSTVIDANAKKLADKLANGKIAKPEGFVGPEGQLQELIDKALNFTPPEQPNIGQLFDKAS